MRDEIKGASPDELVGNSIDELERIYRDEIKVVTPDGPVEDSLDELLGVGTLYRGAEGRKSSWVTPVELVIDSTDELEGVSQGELKEGSPH